MGLWDEGESGAYFHVFRVEVVLYWLSPGIEHR
jgi:hypothetical protein